jgi:hypothetical protein
MAHGRWQATRPSGAPGEVSLRVSAKPLFKGGQKLEIGAGNCSIN